MTRRVRWKNVVGAVEEDRLRQLGKVEYVKLSREDHGVLCLWIGLDFGGVSQAFGGQILCVHDKVKDRRVGTAGGLTFILRILDLFGVNMLEQINGRPVYALRDSPRGLITGLETPSFDGGKRFLVVEWQREWFPEAS